MRGICGLVLILSWTSDCVGAQGLVWAELAKDAAWTGERVPLVITLFSPGPFSGTASFDLPELPRTAIVKIGNPLVGTEEVAGESYFIQRHEFAVYTQRNGEIVIPSFQVRYSGKNDFTSKPESRESIVPELRFDSRRPPGTESMGVVVSAMNMQIQQSWNPAQTVGFVAGDLVQRTVTRSAEGTTAMMLPPAFSTVPDGIRLHISVLDVQDKVERGQSGSLRNEILKYQFERAGSYRLPEIEFHWWDPKKESLQHEILPGLKVDVAILKNGNLLFEDSPEPTSPSWRLIKTRLLGFGLLTGLAMLTLWKIIQHRQLDKNRPEVLATSELRKACVSNNAQAAYAALLVWFNAIEHEEGVGTKESLMASVQETELHEQWQILARHLFAAESTSMEWNSKLLWAAFAQSKKRLSLHKSRAPKLALPPLNPTFMRTRLGGGSTVL